MIERYTRPEMGAVWSDENRFRIWLRIEILACEAMHKLRRISDGDLQLIKSRADFNVARINEIEKEVRHDVIAFLTNVAEYVGPAARHIHSGLTSSDVLDTALSVQIIQALDLLIRDVRAVRRAVRRQAQRHRRTPMIGRSHGVHAEPITFGMKMAVMYSEFERVMKRLCNARETIRFGKLSGAVGTHAHLPVSVETYVCRKLGLQPAPVSTRVLQRDRHAEVMAAIALAGASVERWAQEFRHLQRTEVAEVEEAFGKGQKGSSAMPHKKNPITGEKLCGLARLLRGNLVAAVENIALWHERDISHSSVERIVFPDSAIALDHMLVNLEQLTRGLRVDRKRMALNLNMTRGLIHSQQVLLRLTEKGVAREEAYRLVQRHALAVGTEGPDFQQRLAGDPECTRHLSADALAGLFDLECHFKDVDRMFKAVGLD